MIGLQLLPVVISFIVLGAHFLRDGNNVMMIVLLVLMALLGVRRPWTTLTVQAALLLGAMEWVRTLVILAGARADAGQPVLRLTLILAGVALLTALSALVFRTARLKDWYQPNKSTGQGIEGSRTRDS